MGKTSQTITNPVSKIFHIISLQLLFVSLNSAFYVNISPDRNVDIYVYIYHAAPPAIIKFFADFSNFCLADFLFLKHLTILRFAGFSAFCPPAGFHGKNLAPKYTEIFDMGSSWRLQLPPLFHRQHLSNVSPGAYTGLCSGGGERLRIGGARKISPRSIIQPP